MRIVLATLVVSALTGLHGKTFAATVTLPRLKLDLRWEDGGSAQAPILQGSAIFSDLPGGATCLLLPVNDKTYFSRSRATSRFDEVASRQPPRANQHGTIEVSSPSEAEILFDGTVLRIADVSIRSSVTVSFRTKINQLSTADASPHVLDGFYPLLLQSCPKNLAESVANHRVQTTLAIDRLPGWQTITNGIQDESASDHRIFAERLRGEIALVMFQDSHRRQGRIGSLPVSYVSSDQEFSQLDQSVELAISGMITLFGDFPEPRLAVIETSETVRANLPGIVSIQRPKQSLFASLQNYWLNWSHWNLMTNLAAQWFGAAIRPASIDDSWMNHGIADFAAFYVLRKDGSRFNLFNKFQSGRSPVQFNYREIQDVSAALLQRQGFRTPLVGRDGKTSIAYEETHPLAFVRHTFAVREIFDAIGAQAFETLMRDITSNLRDHSISPAAFMRAALDSSLQSASQAKLVTTTLEYWWQSALWPDLNLAKFEARSIGKNQYLATVNIEVTDGRHSPVEVQISDEAGRVYRSRARSDGPGKMVAEVVTETRPEVAVIDPERLNYDRDRFNNSTEISSVQFLPGSANRLADDGYTIAWIPYPFKRPGEPFSLGVDAAILQYLHHSTALSGHFSFSDNRGGLRVRHMRAWADTPLKVNLEAEQDRYLRRRSGASIYYPDVLAASFKVDLSASMRIQENVGLTNSRHAAFSSSITISSKSRSARSRYQLGVDGEVAPSLLADDFSYQRLMVSGELSLSLTQLSAISIRGFGGILSGEGSMPPIAYFRPQDLSESRLRLDVPDADAPLLSNIRSANVNVEGPIYLPLPDTTMMLTKQIRWRLFFDVGGPPDAWHSFRAAGAGIVSPFGGELVGVGSLAVTRLTIMAVLWKETPYRDSYAPSLLIDFGSSL